MCEHSVVQSCLTICDPMDYILPVSSLHGIFQARILEWVAKPSSRGSSKPWDQTPVSCVSCIGRKIIYYTTWEALPLLTLLIADTKLLPLVPNSLFCPLFCKSGAVMFPAHAGAAASSLLLSPCGHCCTPTAMHLVSSSCSSCGRSRSQVYILMKMNKIPALWNWNSDSGLFGRQE